MKLSDENKRIKDFLIDQIKDKLDEKIIGWLMEPNIDLSVKIEVVNVLENYKNAGLIVSYGYPTVFSFSSSTELKCRVDFQPIGHGLNQLIHLEFSIRPLGINEEEVVK